MANLVSDIKILDPGSGLFCPTDYGQMGDSVVLLNILIELRVHSIYLQAMNPGLVTEDLAQLRIDVANDPTSLTPYTPTSSF